MMIPRAKHLVTTLIIMLSLNLSAQEWPDIPEGDSFVVDMAEILTMDEADALNIKLITYYDTSSYMAIIVTVNDLRGKEIGEFARGLMKVWGIGSIKNDKVLLIVVKPRINLHRMQMTIVANKRMMEDINEDTFVNIASRDFMPDLIKGRYYYGLQRGTDALIAALSGSYPAGKDLPEPRMVTSRPFTIVLIVIVLLLILRIVLIYRKSKDI